MICLIFYFFLNLNKNEVHHLCAQKNIKAHKNYEVHSNFYNHRRYLQNLRFRNCYNTRLIKYWTNNSPQQDQAHKQLRSFSGHKACFNTILIFFYLCHSLSRSSSLCCFLPSWPSQTSKPPANLIISGLLD